MEPLDTPDKIRAVMDRMRAAMPGWEPPAAYGVTLVPHDVGSAEGVRFPVVNVGVHGFPAVALGEVTGRRSETATYRIAPEQLRRCVEIVALQRPPRWTSTRTSTPGESWSPTWPRPARTPPPGSRVSRG